MNSSMFARIHRVVFENVLIAIFLSFGFHSVSVAESTMQSNNMPREKFAPCPESPNCVSSMADDSEHKIAPLEYSESSQDAFQRVKNIIHSMARSKVIEDDYPYLHAEFRSLIFRFVDDVEILVNSENQIIDIHSASRLGYSDFGVNRGRVTHIREKFASESSQ